MKLTPVTVLGLGAMGSALARAFVEAGHPTTVWNRTAAKTDALSAAGATAADTVADAVAASPLVIVCVVDNDAAFQTLQSAVEPLAGRALVNLTNGTPNQARELAAWAAGHRADYLDGGIMAIPPMIGRPEPRVFYSGSPTAFEGHRQTLERLGAATYVGPDPGLAALLDLALLSAMYGLFAGFLHSAALVTSAGLEVTGFMELLLPWLDAMKAQLPQAAEQIDSRDYGEEAVSPLAMQAAGFVNFVTAAADQGIRPDLLVPMKNLIDEAVAAGHGNHDIASLIEVMHV